MARKCELATAALHFQHSIESEGVSSVFCDGTAIFCAVRSLVKPKIFSSSWITTSTWRSSIWKFAFFLFSFHAVEWLPSITSTCCSQPASTANRQMLKKEKKKIKKRKETSGMSVSTILCKSLVIPLYFNVKYCTDPTVYVLSMLKRPFHSRLFPNSCLRR